MRPCSLYLVELKYETLRLEELHKSETEKSINTEKKSAELREEILKVKKEKHEISSDIKSVKSIVHDQEIKMNKLLDKVKSTEKALEAKDNLVNVKTAEADDQRNKVRELKRELDDLNEKLDKIIRMKLVKDKFHSSC